MLTKLKSYTESASKNTVLKNFLMTAIRKPNGRLMIVLLFHKMIYTPLQGKQNLVDTYLTFLSYILIPMQLILMNVKHRDKILLLSHAPIFMIQVTLITGKPAPLLTHPYYIPQILDCMYEVKILRLPQTFIILIIPNKHPSQIRTSKLHINLCNNHHPSRMTTLQYLRSTILLSKLFLKKDVVILEAANTTHALILALITQKNTDSYVCKNLSKLLFCATLILYF